MSIPNPPQIGTKSGTLPQDSTPFERRQNTLIQLHNRKVREVFSDVFDIPADGIPYDPSKITPVNSPRRVLRSDLLIEDGDSHAEMWQKRELLILIDKDDAPVILPSYENISISALDKPQVHLRFIERKGTAIVARRRRAEALISFRLMDKTISTVTQADINELKREIGLAFPSSYQVKKGRIKYSYRDKKNGFEFILTLQNETEAREVITKVVGIRDKTPDWDFLSASTSEKNFTVRKTISILNKIEKLPLDRPIADCYLKEAVIRFGNLKTIVILQRAV